MAARIILISFVVASGRRQLSLSIKSCALALPLTLSLAFFLCEKRKIVVNCANKKENAAAAAQRARECIKSS